MKYHLTFFGNSKDNIASIGEGADWNAVCSLLTTHTTTEAKDTLMVCPARFVEGGGDPVRRCAANVVEYSMLGLDIDGGFSISAFRSKFRPWRYVAYSTYSHRTAKKSGQDAFRAFFPLNTPAPAAVFRDMRPEIKTWAGIGDRSQLDLSRGFYLPTCPADRLVLAESWVNDGQVLEWSGWATAAAARIEREKAAPVADHQEITDTEREKLLTKLKGRYVGQEPLWWRIGIAMASNGFTLDDFRAVTLGGLMRQKSASDCDAKWRHCLQQAQHGKQISLGFLINVANGKFVGGVV
ncbi:hypothetical protein [Paramagnetospirillum magneticum]|uniref:Uncharacterized protein n=1 Tax=Paramagnetospirillum magneticum (strain ATCC 700264 / AMB-1) TaxID=342108 RepID=Q2W2D9_PARM1|nr:hypothetical protein [Paramagnetospirillum magneticum]BAE51986.1 hypothetical protein amb3182 [Paramagnetospirillum magneticum AMB-1]